MALIAKEKSGAGFEPIEAGTYPARCSAVVDLGVQVTEYKGQRKEQEKVMFIFELPTERIMTENGEKPRLISARYTVSLSERATLRSVLNAWRGKPFTAEELNGFNLASVVNAPCMLTISHTISNGNTYANVSGVSKAMKGMEVPALDGEPIVFDMGADNAEITKAKLPQWVQDVIEKSPTWNGNAAGKATFEEVDGEDDELPF